MLGPPQLGVVGDGNTTLGRSLSFSLVLERKGLPTSACAVPPPWGGVRVHGGFLLLPGGGGLPLDCRTKRVGVLSKPQRVRSTWGLETRAGSTRQRVGRAS